MRLGKHHFLRGFAPTLLFLALMGGWSPAALASAHRVLDEANLDRSVSPRQDFYQFANGGWLSKTEIPADYGRWGTFEELNERVLVQLHDIAREAAAADPTVGSVEQKVGTFFASGMDVENIERAGAAALEPAMLQIDRVTDPTTFAEAIAELHKIGASPLFALAAAPDSKNSSRTVAHMWQAGMGLPEPDDYLANDKAERRKAYLAHIEAMFALLGLIDESAAQRAETVLSIETALAEQALDVVRRRDPSATYHQFSATQLAQDAPGCAWRLYFNQLGLTALKADGCIIVEHPPFVTHAAALVEKFTWAQWRSYLIWETLNRSASYLNDAFVQEHFNFYGRTMLGAQALPPRYKRVLGTLDNYLGEALGELYVRKAFSPEARSRAEDMVHTLRQALSKRIDAIAWMSDTTKARAQDKLAQLRIKVGYPDKFMDYSELVLGHSYLSNVWHAHAFLFADNLSRVGQAPDLSRWEMTPQTVNAYYSPNLNEIVFPAAILQAPFFDLEGDDAANFGAIGGVIGHELSHGFDDQGRLYDGAGNLKDWWTDADAAAFTERSAAIVKQFDHYAIFEHQVNGALTQGENIADLGGAKIAFAALQSKLSAASWGERDTAGFLPQQRFFLAWAQVWRNQVREATALQRLESDPHAPGLWRTNGPLSNMEEFYEAFAVRPGDDMYRDPASRVSIW